MSPILTPAQQRRAKVKERNELKGEILYTEYMLKNYKWGAKERQIVEKILARMKERYEKLA